MRSFGLLRRFHVFRSLKVTWAPVYPRRFLFTAYIFTVVHKGVLCFNAFCFVLAPLLVWVARFSRVNHLSSWIVNVAVHFRNEAFFLAILAYFLPSK